MCSWLHDAAGKASKHSGRHVARTKRLCAGCVRPDDVSTWGLALHVEAGEVSIHHCNVEVHTSRSMGEECGCRPPPAGYVAVRLAGEVKISSFFFLLSSTRAWYVLSLILIFVGSGSANHATLLPTSRSSSAS